MEPFKSSRVKYRVTMVPKRTGQWNATLFHDQGKTNNSILGSWVFIEKIVLLKLYQWEKATPKCVPKVRMFFSTTKAHTVGSLSKGIFRSFVGGQEGRCSILACEYEPGKPGYAFCHVAWAMGLVLWSWFLEAEIWSFIKGSNNLLGLSFNTMKWWTELY